MSIWTKRSIAFGPHVVGRYQSEAVVFTGEKTNLRQILLLPVTLPPLTVTHAY